MARLYINLATTDLSKATAFYEALGFTKNTELWDDTLSVMLLTHGFFQGFIGTRTISHSIISTEVLNALQFDSREAVDAFFEKAIAAGGTKTIETQDHGFMYGRDFTDLDGHIWEAFWMDVSQMPKE